MPAPELLISRLKRIGPKDTELRCANFGLFDEDVVDTIVPFLRKHPHISVLSVYQNNIESTGAKAIATLTSLRVINFGSNNVGDEGGLALCRNRHIERLCLMRNNLMDEGAVRIAVEAQQIQLDISRNLIDEGIMSKVAERIRANNEALCEAGRFPEAKEEVDWLERTRPNRWLYHDLPSFGNPDFGLWGSNGKTGEKESKTTSSHSPLPSPGGSRESE